MYDFNFQMVMIKKKKQTNRMFSIVKKSFNIKYLWKIINWFKRFLLFWKWTWLLSQKHAPPSISKRIGNFGKPTKQCQRWKKFIVHAWKEVSDNHLPVTLRRSHSAGPSSSMPVQCSSSARRCSNEQRFA